MKRFSYPKISYGQESMINRFNRQVDEFQKELDNFIINGGRVVNDKLGVLDRVYPKSTISTEELNNKSKQNSHTINKLYKLFKNGNLTNLEGIILNGDQLFDINLSEVNMKGSMLHYNFLKNVDFSCSDLSNSSLYNYFDECKFDNAKYENTILIGIFKNCDFKNIHLDYYNRTYISGIFLECQFEDITLETLNFSGSYFIDCDFKNVKISIDNELKIGLDKTLKFDSFSKLNFFKKNAPPKEWLSKWDLLESDI